jgi:hypothetical protein
MRPCPPEIENSLAAHVADDAEQGLDDRVVVRIGDPLVVPEIHSSYHSAMMS